MGDSGKGTDITDQKKGKKNGKKRKKEKGAFFARRQVAIWSYIWWRLSLSLLLSCHVFYCGKYFFNAVGTRENNRGILLKNMTQKKNTHTKIEVEIVKLEVD